MPNQSSASEQDMPASFAQDHDSNPSRIFSLDVLRGIALLGILLISIWEFGGFSVNEQNGLRLFERGNDYNLFAHILIFFEGKMRALFSLVFGAGIILYMAKPNQLTLPGSQEL